MPEPLEIQFMPLSTAPTGATLLLAGQELTLASVARAMDERSKGALIKAARAADFTGKAKTAIEVLGRLDGYAPTEGDMADFERHRAQLTAQFLLDRDAIVRWTHVEFSEGSLEGVDRMPSDDELLTAARAL